jgi:uncharacterized membrane protein
MQWAAAVRLAHIAAGAAALFAGFVTLRARKGTLVHKRTGVVYFLLVTLTCASAAVLSVMEKENRWPFLFVAAGTYAFAVAGFASRGGASRRSLVTHVVGLTSSYAGLLMAFIVNNFGKVTGIELPFLARLLPLQFLSTCVVVYVAVLVYRGRLPRNRV